MTQCQDCIYWVRDVKAKLEPRPATSGRCRWGPPVLAPITPSVLGVERPYNWPATLQWDWCGRAQARERVAPVSVPALPVVEEAPKPKPKKRGRGAQR